MDFRPTPKPATQPNTTEAAVAVAAPEAPSVPIQASKTEKTKKSSKQLATWLIVIILLLLVAAIAFYYMHRYNDSQKQVRKLSSNPAITAQQEQQNLISKVGALTVLPTGETPTIATVTDITKLTDQPFFANAKDGDKVLIYTQAKKAYLYRPSTDKLINIAPVNIGNNQTGSTGTTGTTTQNQTTTKTSTTTKKP